MSYPHLFLHDVAAVFIRRDRITIDGQPREIVTLTVAGHRPREQWTITLDPGHEEPLHRIQFIEQAGRGRLQRGGK